MAEPGEVCHDESLNAKIGALSTTMHGLNMPLLVAFVTLVGAFMWFMVVENARQHQALIDAIDDQTMVMMTPEDKQDMVYKIIRRKFETRNHISIP